MLIKTLILASLLSFQFRDETGNLVSNSQFNSDIFDWFNVFVLGSWIPDDGAPNSGNGSMQITGNANDGTSFNKFSQSFPIDEYYTYEVKSWFKIPSDSSVPQAWVGLGYYDEFATPMGESNPIESPLNVDKDQWFELSGYITVPKDAAIAEIRVNFVSGDGSSSLTPYGLWDDVTVRPDTIHYGNFEF